MPPMTRHEQLTQRWNAINKRFVAHADGTAEMNLEDEGKLLQELDEIEYEVGVEYLKQSRRERQVRPKEEST